MIWIISKEVISPTPKSVFVNTIMLSGVPQASKLPSHAKPVPSLNLMIVPGFIVTLTLAGISNFDVTI